jgi:hypothetical protein
VTRTESTIGGVPAYQSEAYSELIDMKHDVYYFQAPGDSVNIWSIGLDTEGTQADPAWQAIVDSFEFTD